ncbi:MAG: hypothetical protein FWF50_00400, partial [Defluviitaleaceae bacterium]|nr:hypothetical protein [Defluviitaleaceae bacterium]
MPKLPKLTREEALNSIITSVAMEEAAISKILSSIKPCEESKHLLDSLVDLEIILKNKLKLALEMMEKPPTSSHNKPHEPHKPPFHEHTKVHHHHKHEHYHHKTNDRHSKFHHHHKPHNEHTNPHHNHKSHDRHSKFH